MHAGVAAEQVEVGSEHQRFARAGIHELVHADPIDGEQAAPPPAVPQRDGEIATDVGEGLLATSLQGAREFMRIGAAPVVAAQARVSGEREHEAIVLEEHGARERSEACEAGLWRCLELDVGHRRTAAQQHAAQRGARVSVGSL